MTRATRFPSIRAIAFYTLIAVAIYAVVRLSVVIAIPALYVDKAWIASLADICPANRDLCVAVSVERRKVGEWWYGYGLYFQATKGNSARLRSLVLADLPEQNQNRSLNKWHFVGVAVTE